MRENSIKEIRFVGDGEKTFMNDFIQCEVEDDGTSMLRRKAKSVVTTFEFKGTHVEDTKLDESQSPMHQFGFGDDGMAESSSKPPQTNDSRRRKFQSEENSGRNPKSRRSATDGFLDDERVHDNIHCGENFVRDCLEGHQRNSFDLLRMEPEFAARQFLDEVEEEVETNNAMVDVHEIEHTTQQSQRDAAT
ncbi:hypothetical protein QJS10_CPB18g00760 [Acorus calamus]|uniref:Uncharacterized protein n=1 Tax=Acorus calamus TaxID=4465 RepID=A0AAV9CQZ5_ACOCL|nr:hypothetical protein QJS10_CPB18g00760 [Acorus calamus]